MSVLSGYNCRTFSKSHTSADAGGSTIKAVCVIMSVNYKIPLAKIVQLMEDLYQIRINESSIINWLKQSYNLMKPTEDQVKEHLLNSKLVHADETGVNINGKKLLESCSID
ncbi:MAG: transposase [Saprospiraceae bacterium]|nr:transposase [Saprospiraceae bacterium]